MESGTSTPGRWERLGALLIQRRTQLSPRFHNRGAFCEAAGLNYRLVYDVEEARRTNFGGPVLAAIESAYRLEPGAISRFLAGGDAREILPGQEAAATPSRVVPPPRREDVDFSGGDPEGLRPWRQQVLRQLYDALGVLPRLGPGELPEPRELPGIEEALASMPRDWAPFTAEKEAAAWNDRALSLHERLTVIAVMRWAIARMDAGQRDRRTGLIATAHNYPASAWIPSLVSVGQKALRASP